MADKVQKVIYRILVETVGLAEQVAAAKAQIATLHEADKKYADAAVKNAERVEKARRKANEAHQVPPAPSAPGSASGGTSGRSTPGPSTVTHTERIIERVVERRAGHEKGYHAQLDIVIAELQRIAGNTRADGSTALLGGSGGGERATRPTRAATSRRAKQEVEDGFLGNLQAKMFASEVSALLKRLDKNRKDADAADKAAREATAPKPMSDLQRKVFQGQVDSFNRQRAANQAEADAADAQRIAAEAAQREHEANRVSLTESAGRVRRRSNLDDPDVERRPDRIVMADPRAVGRYAVHRISEHTTPEQAARNEATRRSIREEGFDPRHAPVLYHDSQTGWATLHQGNHRTQIAAEEGVGRIPLRIVDAPVSPGEARGHRLYRGDFDAPGPPPHGAMPPRRVNWLDGNRERIDRPYIHQPSLFDEDPAEATGPQLGPRRQPQGRSDEAIRSAVAQALLRTQNRAVHGEFARTGALSDADRVRENLLIREGNRTRTEDLRLQGLQEHAHRDNTEQILRETRARVEEHRFLTEDTHQYSEQEHWRDRQRSREQRDPSYMRRWRGGDSGAIGGGGQRPGESDLDYSVRRARANAQLRTSMWSTRGRDSSQDVDEPGLVRRTARRAGRRIARSPLGAAANQIRQISDRLSGDEDGEDKVGKRLKYWQVLLGALLYAGAALVPVIAVVAAALGAMLSTLTVAFSAVGVFAIAAIGHFKRLQTVLKDAYANAKVVPKPFQEVAAAFDALKKAYDSFLDATQAPVLAVFADGMNVIARLLPRLVPLVERAAVGLRAGLAFLDRGFSGAGFASFLEFLEVKTPRVLSSLTRSLANIAAGLAGLAQSFGPYIDWFLHGLEGMAKGFRDWASGLATSKAFKEFMDYARDNVWLVVAGLKALVSLLINLGVALAPAGKLLILVLIFVDWLTSIKALMPFLQALTVILFTWLGLSALYRLFILIATGLYRLSTVMSAVTGTAIGMGRAFLWVSLVTAALAAGLFLWDAYKDKQREAADAVESHRQAVRDLSDELAANGGVASESFKKQQNADLDKKVEGPGFWERVTGERGGDTTVAAQLGKAGINRSTAVAGASGDQDARNSVRDKFNAYIDAQQKMGNKDNVDDAKRAFIEYFTGTASAVEAATEAQDDFARAAMFATKALTAQEKAAAHDAAMITKLAEKTERQKQLDAAVQAKTAMRDSSQQYTQSQRDYRRAVEDQPITNRRAHNAVIDAEIALTDAQRRSRESQIALTQTRIRAADQLEDLKNKLRDVALNEEGASIAYERAQISLRRVMADPLSSTLDRRQAILDAQRSKNDLDDTRAEGARTVRDAPEDERKIKESVIQASRDATAAARDEARARQAVSEAQLAEKRAIEDSQLAVDTSKQNMEDMKIKADEAWTAFQVLNGTLATTPELLQGIIDKWPILADLFKQGLATTGIDDIAGRAKLTIQYLEARRLMDQDKDMSAAEAWAKAGKVASEIGSGSLDRTPQTGNYPNAPAAVVPTKKKPAKAGPGRHNASGGPVFGAGTRTSDDVPVWASNDEHIWSAAEVAALGGHDRMINLRNAALAGRFGATEVDAVANGFNPASMYAGLSVTPRVSTPAATAVGAVRSMASAGGGGFSVGDVTINNPVREPAGESLYRSVRRLAFEYDN